MEFRSRENYQGYNQRMNLVSALAAAIVFGGSGEGANITPPVDQILNVPPPASRFEMQDPTGGLPAVMLDWTNDSIGLAQQSTRGVKKYQARIMWIDATANVDRYNTEDKIVKLVAALKDVGFNTIILDVKPISGQVIYNSKIAPKLAEWKGRQLPADFDPLTIFCREARKDDITLCVSLNAFSEGHNLMHAGPGYSGDMARWQSVLYEVKIDVQDPAKNGFAVSPDFNKMPADENTLGAFNSVSALPPSSDASSWAAINKYGTVLQAGPGSTLGTVKMPSGGSVLIGTGRAAAFLQSFAPLGGQLSFVTTPEYVRTGERPDQQIPLMMNPLLTDVQNYERSIVKELVQNYDISGIVYDDRLRYAGINADFSDYTQAKFETYLKKRVVWPDDVFKFTVTPGLNRGLNPGQYYDAWMIFRAQVIRNYVLSVKDLIKKLKPNLLFGVYAGSWYGEYPRIGQNWAAPEASAGFWFQTAEYAQTGLAPQLDFLITGCYYPTATIKEAMTNAVPIGFTVESAGNLTNRLVRDQTWSYAGLSLDQFRGNPEGLKNAIQAACGTTQGVMLFDLSHDIESMWPVLQQAFQIRVPAPHSEPDLLAEVRRRRAAVDKVDGREPPIIINSGSAGIGQN